MIRLTLPRVAALACAFATTLTLAAPLQFTQPLGGTAGASVASLEFGPDNGSTGDDWSFSLFAQNLSPTAVIAAIALDIDGATPVDYVHGLTSPRVEGGVSSVTLKDGGGPDASFPVIIKLGKGQDKFKAGEGAIFSLDDTKYTNLKRFALKVVDQGKTTWYVPAGQATEAAPQE